MPFTSGTFANVAGASSAAAGQIVQSAVWNAIHVDYSTAFTQLMQQLLSTVSNRNICWMNGGFEIWQRTAAVVGTSGSGGSVSVAQNTTAYTADRWYLTTGANQSHVVQQFLPGLVSASASLGIIARNAAQIGTTAMVFGYPLDSDEVARMRGSKITISFLVQAGATFSPTNGTLTATLYVGTGTPAKRGGGFTSETTVLTIATNLTTAVVSVSGTSSAVVPDTATQGEIQFTWTPVGVAGATDFFALDDVQIECNLTSTTWTPMDFDRLDFNTMLEGCKRHYTKTNPYTVAPGAGSGLANSVALLAQSAERVSFWAQWPVELRTNPTVTKSNPVTATSSNFYLLTSIAGTVTNSLSTVLDTTNTNATKGLLIYTGASATAAGSAFFLHLQADAGI